MHINTIINLVFKQLKCSNYQYLQSTSIGKTINKLKQEDGPLGEKATKLINNWKQIATTTTKSNNTPEKSKQKLSNIQSYSPSPLNSVSVVENKKNNVSFEDMLMMPLYDMDKKKKKKRKDDSPFKVCCCF